MDEESAFLVNDDQLKKESRHPLTLNPQLYLDHVGVWFEVLGKQAKKAACIFGKEARKFAKDKSAGGEEKDV